MPSRNVTISPYDLPGGRANTEVVVSLELVDANSAPQPGYDAVSGAGVVGTYTTSIRDTAVTIAVAATEGLTPTLYWLFKAQWGSRSGLRTYTSGLIELASAGGDLTLPEFLALEQIPGTITGLTADELAAIRGAANPSATNVFATVDDVTAGVAGVASFEGRTGAVAASTGDYTAAEITNVPTGALAAVTVQAALNELDSEKAAASHTHAAGDITSGTVATARLGSGTADSTTYLRGDQTWQTISASSSVEDAPVNGHTTVGISSNWAYDHVEATDPHTGYALESALGTAAYTASTAYDVAGAAAAITLTGLGAGTAATHAVTDFATAAQGTDARTPTAHATSHATGQSDALTASNIGAQVAMDSASQVEMETGTEAALRAMSPLRVSQAIAALAATSQARRHDWVSPYDYCGLAPAGTPDSAAAWDLTRIQLSAVGAVVAALTATNITWDDRLTATYS